MPTLKYQPIFNDLVAKYNPAALAGWQVNATGDIVKDFYRLTDNQGGGKSKDPNDSASAYPPPAPDKDGQTYHTVRDVTWRTYSNVMKKNRITPTPERFYKMSDNDKLLVVKDFMSVGNKTQSPVINAVIAFFYWGGSADSTIKQFAAKHGPISVCITQKGEAETLDLLLLERISFLQKLNPRYATGWTRGCLVFWKVFSDNIKKKS